ncbi:MAG: hypothetical protein PHO75_02295 [Candidatus Shapirobacteria bacterium]|nr:hypothetical protein [Candidatus Shapirobacteria bacterium]
MSITITTLYGGKVTMRFDSYWHTYTVTDEEKGLKDASVTGVSTVLNIIDKSKQLVPWAVNQTIDYLKENLKPGISYDEVEIAKLLSNAKNTHHNTKNDAGDFGTLLHNWVEKFVKHENPPMPVNKVLRKSVEDFLRWTVKDKVKFVLSEQPLYSRKYQCAGTLDCIATVNGKLYIGDWKTSSGIYLSQKIQTAGYRMMREEEYSTEKYVGQFIMRFGKDGAFEKKFLDDKEDNSNLEKMFLYFLKAGDIYRKMDAK